jgi:RecB family exonuclease
MTEFAPSRDKVAEALRKGPSTLSHTQGEEFHRCPRRWAYHRILEKDPEAGESQESLVYGNCGHRALENIARGVNPGQATQASLTAMATEAVGAPWLPDASRKLGMHIQGFTTHYWPRFTASWQIMAVEKPFAYDMGNGILRRGVIDIIARSRYTGKLGIFDYKFAGEMYVKILTESLSFSAQLSTYLFALLRTITGEVPGTVGYIFLKKLRDNEHISNLVSDPKKYTDAAVTVDTRFMEYAASVEANDASIASLMLHYKQSYIQFGPASLAAVPANFGGCVMYNKKCGFSDGCHCGKPLHITLRESL